jgi:LmbE family N-acetylglucosaminyl deacetylase
VTRPAVSGARVLVVLAHPDDESLACGGTIALLSRHGAHVRIVCATHGETGSMNPAVVTARADLAPTRAAEFAAACRHLGASDADLLDFPDGSLSWADVSRFEDTLEAILRRWRPDAVITFGRDGLYWHPDHIAVGERVRTAVARGAGEFAVAAYAVVMPPGAMSAVATEAVQHRPGVASAFWGVAPEVFGKGALPATRIIDVSPVIEAKLAALQAHASQIDASNPLAYLTPATASPLAVEHFHLLETSPAHRSALDLLTVAPRGERAGLARY